MELRPVNSSYTPENIALLIETNSRLAEENTQFKQNLEAAEKKIDLLIEQLKLGKQRQFGKKNESSGYLQLELVFDEIEETKEDNKEEATEEPTVTETITYIRKKKTVGRNIDTSKLPREQVIYDLTEEEKSCCQCGGQHVIGFYKLVKYCHH